MKRNCFIRTKNIPWAIPTKDYSPKSWIINLHVINRRVDRKTTKGMIWVIRNHQNEYRGFHKRIHTRTFSSLHWAIHRKLVRCHALLLYRSAMTSQIRSKYLTWQTQLIRKNLIPLGMDQVMKVLLLPMHDQGFPHQALGRIQWQTKIKVLTSWWDLNSINAILSCQCLTSTKRKKTTIWKALERVKTIKVNRVSKCVEELEIAVIFSTKESRKI